MPCFRANGAKTFQMLVNRPRSNFASAGSGNFRFSVAAQQGTQQVITGPKTLGVPVGDFRTVGRTRIHTHAFTGFVVHFCSQLNQDISQGVDVFNIGKVFDRAGLITKKRSGIQGTIT